MKCVPAWTVPGARADFGEYVFLPSGLCVHRLTPVWIDGE